MADGPSRALHDHPRVLVVNDHRDTCVLLKQLLEMNGFEVEVAENGKAALEKVKNAHVDLVFLDVMMPTMDGLSVCRTIKSSPSTASLPVILHTAVVDESVRVQAMKLGACDFVKMPVEPAEMIRRVRAQLKRAAARA
jgi:two-component system OmpR family response regulator